MSVETELANTHNVTSEATRLYKTLQTAVDREMQSTGFVPSGKYGAVAQAPALQATPVRTHVNGSGHSKPWKASDKQRELVLKLVENSGIELEVVETISEETFGHGDLPELNKIQMSGLIDELLSRYGKRQKRDTTPAAGRFNGRTFPRGAWLDVEGLHPSLSNPFFHRLCNELGAVIRADELRSSSLLNQLLQCVDDAQRCDRIVHLKCQAFAGVFIKDRQSPPSRRPCSV